MSSTLTPSGWIVDKDVVDERKDLPRLTSAQVDILNGKIAAGSNEYPVGTKIVRTEDGVTLTLEGVGSAARFVPPGLAPVLSVLAAPTGASLVGYDGGTLQDMADQAKPLASYAALRAYTGRASGVRITAAGVAGQFQRDDTDTTTADNGGTVIVDASGRRWKRIAATIEACVKWFGALGDGITDDSTSVEKALNSGAAIVSFTAGAQYKITRALAIGVSALTVFGNGARLAQATPHASGLVVGQTAAGAYVKVEGVYFFGLKMRGADDGVGSAYGAAITVRAPATNPYVQFDGCNDIRVERCEFEGWCMSTVATAVTGLHWHKNTSKNTYFYATLTAGGYGLLAQTCFDIFAEGNKFLSVAKASPGVTTDRHAFYISADPTRGFSSDNVCRNVTLTGNHIDWRNTHPVTGFEYGMALRGASNVRVVGNTQDGGSAGIAFNTENANSFGLVIANNVLTDLVAPGPGEISAINVFQGSGANIATNVSVTGNTVSMTGSTAVLIQISGVDGAAVGGNVVSSSGTVTAGIGIAKNVANLSLLPNTIKVAGGQAVLFSGTGSDGVTVHRQHIKMTSGFRYRFLSVPANLTFAFPRSFQFNANSTGAPTFTAGVDSPVVSVAVHGSGFTVTFDGSVDTSKIGPIFTARNANVAQAYIHSVAADTLNVAVLSFAGAVMPAASNTYNIQVQLAQ